MNTEILRLMRFIENLETTYFKEINISRSRLFELRNDPRLIYKAKLETVLKLYQYMQQHNELKQEEEDVENTLTSQHQTQHGTRLSHLINLDAHKYVGVDLGSKNLIAATNNDFKVVFRSNTNEINRLTKIYDKEIQQAKRSEFKTLEETLRTKFIAQIEGEVNYQVNQLIKKFDQDTIFVVGDQNFKSRQGVNDKSSSTYIIWDLIMRQLKRKLNDNKRLIITDETGSSIKCPNCGRKKRSNRTRDNRFKCKKCGFKHESDDVVASFNILNKYLSSLIETN